MSVGFVNTDRWAVSTARSTRSSRRVTTVERRRQAASRPMSVAATEGAGRDIVLDGSWRRDWRWPNALVPYAIDPDVSDRTRVTQAIARWEDLVEVRFVERNQSACGRFPSWLRFRAGRGSVTAVGMQGGEQVITVDPRTTADSVVRLIGHALGVTARDDHYVAAARQRYPLVKQVPGSFGAAPRAADIAVAGISGRGEHDLIVFHADGGVDASGYLRVGRALNRFGTVTRGWSAPVAVPGPWSVNVAGGGVAAGDLGGHGSVDVVVWCAEANADDRNCGWLRVGRGIDRDGVATGGWSSPVVVPGGQGRGCRGGGITLADLSGSGRLDLIVLYVASHERGASLSYRVGHDLAPSGQAAGWSAAMPVPTWSARACQGTGIAVAERDGNGRADLIVGHVGDAMADHQASFRVGRSLAGDGSVTDGWAAAQDIGGWFGWESTHAGIATADLTGNGRADLVVFHVDNPMGESSGFYRLAGG